MRMINFALLTACNPMNSTDQPSPSTEPAVSDEKNPPAPPNKELFVVHHCRKLPRMVLKKILYALFSAFGRIEDVGTPSTEKLASIAFIKFDSVESAARAMSSLQGLPFYTSKLSISYSR